MSAMEQVSRKMKIAVSGLTGAGKSTILNGLVGREVFKEGHNLTHETLEVTPYPWKDPDNNFEVTVYDTPGFEDNTTNGDQYLEKIRSECSDADLLLYCISVQDARPMLNRDQKTLHELKKVFESTVWSHCIIVLTFANAIVMRNKSKFRGKLTMKQKVTAEYNNCIKSWKQDVQKMVSKVGIPNGEKIPILPAGDKVCYSILDNNKYWLSDLYHEAIEICKGDDSEKILIMINAHRLRASTELKKDEFDKEIINQPIVLTNESKKIMDKLHQLAAAVGTGGVTGVVGATIGATIGALAIGLPTFGVAAGAGLVLGAAIGGGIGVGTGIGVYKILQFKKTKHQLDSDVIIEIKGGLFS